MGNGTHNNASPVRVQIIKPQENSSYTSYFVYSGKQQLVVKNPFLQVAPNYDALKNQVSISMEQQENQKIRIVHGLVGLKNLGNTCYFNSAIHSLVNTQPLADYFLSKLYEKEINKKNKQGTGGEVVLGLARLFNEIWKKERSVGIIGQELSQLKSESSQQPPQFEEVISPIKCLESDVIQDHQILEQEDCQELLSYLLDMVHEDLNRANQKNNIFSEIDEEQLKDEERAALSWKLHLSFNKSVIVDIFQGQLRSKIQCLKCNYQSSKFEPYLFLSLPIPQLNKPSPVKVIRSSQENRGNKNSLSQSVFLQTPNNISNRMDLYYSPQKNNYQNPSNKITTDDSLKDSNNSDSLFYSNEQESITLEQCLQYFQEKEIIKGEWQCPKCQINVDCQKQIQLWKLPNILIIHLKRFRFDQNEGKINTNIKFPIEELDLSKYVYSIQKEKPIYSLYSVAQHQGTLEQGHYTSVVKNRNDGRWYLYNDHQVMEVVNKEKLILNSCAYVLFYQKKTSNEIYRQTLSKPEHWPHLPSLFKQQNDIKIINDFSDIENDDSTQNEEHKSNQKQQSQKDETINLPIQLNQRTKVIQKSSVENKSHDQIKQKIKQEEIDLTGIQAFDQKNKGRSTIFEIKSKKVDKFNQQIKK